MRIRRKSVQSRLRTIDTLLRPWGINPIPAVSRVIDGTGRVAKTWRTFICHVVPVAVQGYFETSRFCLGCDDAQASEGHRKILRKRSGGASPGTAPAHGPTCRTTRRTRTMIARGAHLTTQCRGSGHLVSLPRSRAVVPKGILGQDLVEERHLGGHPDAPGIQDRSCSCGRGAHPLVRLSRCAPAYGLPCPRRLGPATISPSGASDMEARGEFRARRPAIPEC